MQFKIIFLQYGTLITYVFDCNIKHFVVVAVSYLLIVVS